MDAFPSTSYVTRISRYRHPTGMDPRRLGDADWEAGLPLTLGYTWEDGRAPALLVTLGGEDVSGAITLDVTAQEEVVMRIGPIEPLFLCDGGNVFYLSSRLAFSPTGSSFSGSVTSTCASRSGTGELLWQGTAGGGGPDGDTAMSELSLDNLYALDDSATVSRVVETWKQCARSAASVKSVFFPKAPHYSSADDPWTDDMAVALVCASLGCSEWSHKIDREAVRKHLERGFADSSAGAVKCSQDLYDRSFPSSCGAGGHLFNEYQNDPWWTDGFYKVPGEWAKELADLLTSSHFIDSEVAKLLAHEPGWKRHLDVAAHKVACLCSSELWRVTTCWEKAFPGMNAGVGFDQYNYLHASDFPEDLFIAEVNAAIAVPTDTGDNCTLHMCVPNYRYGVAVEDFLKGKPKHLKLVS